MGEKLSSVNVSGSIYSNDRVCSSEVQRDLVFSECVPRLCHLWVPWLLALLLCPLLCAFLCLPPSSALFCSLSSLSFCPAFFLSLFPAILSSLSFCFFCRLGLVSLPVSFRKEIGSSRIRGLG